MLNAPHYNHDILKLEPKSYNPMASSRSPYEFCEYPPFLRSPPPPPSDPHTWPGRPRLSHPCHFVADFTIRLLVDGFDASPPPAPVGPPLLDTNEQKGLESWFESIGSGSVTSPHLFDSDLSNDPTYWQPELSPHQPYLGGGMDEFLHNGSVSAAAAAQIPAAPPSQMDVNPFGSGHGHHELLHHHHHHHRQQDIGQQINSHNLLNFGTDTDFAPNGYHPLAPTVPPSDKDVEIRSKIYTAFKNDSTVTTAVNSPAEVKYERTEDTEADDDDDSGTPMYDEDDSTPSPARAVANAKRRLTGDDALSSSKSRKPRPSRKLDSSTAATRAASKKKPPNSTAGTGQKRDNLTEAQKRENHIHSEQKRRNLIRQGFEDLCSLVPELSSGGYSKSAVLVHAANYLDELKKGNARLRVYLQQLQQMQGERVF